MPDSGPGVTNFALAYFFDEPILASFSEAMVSERNQAGSLL